MKYDFCPYEVGGENGFRKINPDNLAYELIFWGGYGIDSLKDTTLAVPDYIKIGIDERLNSKYQDNTTHYMLWEAEEVDGRKVGASGIERLISDLSGEKTERIETGNRGYVTSDEENAKSAEQTKGNIKLSYRKEGSKYVIESVNGIMMEAIPCCPRCHKRMPIGWDLADDFCGISLMGSTTRGKTTFLVSMMARQWEALDITDEWTIAPAHRRVGDVAYDNLYQASKEMCKKNGECPQATVNSDAVRIHPVFLMVMHNNSKKRMIVGLYDNAGEIVHSMNDQNGSTMLFPSMFAHMYFIDPSQMKIRVKCEKSTREFVYEELTIEQQGALQKSQEALKGISGEALLRNEKYEEAQDETGESIMDIFRGYRSIMSNREDGIDIMKNQHFCGTIIKSDMLEGIKEIEEIDKGNLLFHRDSSEELLNPDRMLVKEKTVKTVVERYALNENDIRQIERNMGSVSWHCISALGCDTYETEKVTSDGKRITALKERYNPIRVAEPLVTCIQKRMEQLGWI